MPVRIGRETQRAANAFQRVYTRFSSAGRDWPRGLENAAGPRLVRLMIAKQQLPDATGPPSAACQPAGIGAIQPSMKPAEPPSV